MTDQADRLREMAQSVNFTNQPASPPPLLGISTGKTGLGGSTVALNAAFGLARLGIRVVLVDADLRNADTTGVLLKSSSARGTLCDVLSAKRTVSEALQPGPGDLRLLAGCADATQMPRLRAEAPRELMESLGGLDERPDLVIVDCGCGLSPWTNAWWQSADQMIVVTTPDDMAIMETYALIKVACRHDPARPLALLPNRCVSERQAHQIHAHVAQACFQFLGQFVPTLGWLPDCPASPRPLLHEFGSLDSSFAAAGAELAACIATEMSLTGRPADQRNRFEGWKNHDRRIPEKVKIDSTHASPTADKYQT